MHRVLALLAVPASLGAIGKAWRIKGSWRFIVAALCGLALLLVAAFVEAASAYEEPTTIRRGAAAGQCASLAVGATHQTGR